MSNKGAIKKTPTPKDGQKASTRSRTKAATNEDKDAPGKPEVQRAKKSKDGEQKLEADKPRQRQVPSSRLYPSGQTSKQQTARSIQEKILKENKPAATGRSTSKSDSQHRLRTTNATSRMKIDRSSKSSINSLESSRSKEKLERKDKVQRKEARETEKRGTSVIYMPRPSRTVGKTEKSRAETKEGERSKVSVKTQGSRSQPLARERKLSRTLSPSEVKMLHSAGRKSSSSTNLVDKRALKDSKETQKSKEKRQEDDYDYEDDFEDYESDFQECTDTDGSQISEESRSDDSGSVKMEPIELRTAEQRKTVNSAERRMEEEQMHDSGHYELAEARRRAARMESILASQSKPSTLLELREPVNKAYSSEERPLENKSLPSSTDEGFEDSRSGDFAKSPPLSQITLVDFQKDKESSSAKPAKKSLSRGQQLLEMIKLDAMEWSLLERVPVPYDEFIRTYGRLNTQQMATQTGEENPEVETQTEIVSCGNKWTQFPIACRRILRSKDDLDSFRMEQIGVGSDPSPSSNFQPPSYDILRLNDFLQRAGALMSSLLEEQKVGGKIFQRDSEELIFSDGYLRLSVNSVTFLAERPVVLVQYSEAQSKVLLTVHSPVEEEIETSSKQDYITDCCVGCVWHVTEPSMPKKLFYSPCPITACCFHLSNSNVVFAGHQDGSISLWDLREDEMWHQRVTDRANGLDWTIRTATYTTALNVDVNSHVAEVVAIRTLSKVEVERRSEAKFVPIQICSLDESGLLIIWTALHNMGRNVDDLGLSHWGDIRLMKSQEIFLESSKDDKNQRAFIDMHVDCVESNNIYVATNTTNVLHVSSMHNKTNPPIYQSNEMYPCGSTTCVDICPFQRSFFLVGCDDGTIRLHALNLSRPILRLKDDNCDDKIKTVQWSKSKPFIIYVLDNKSRIHIWDLSKSDVCAAHSVSLENRGNISSMRLSSCKTKKDMSQQYLALAMETGEVEIHRLSREFCFNENHEEFEELDAFVEYISTL
ncbi:hypothetical protein KM043_001161 [Ampulex compressa]|nr:hypothetical protein KM043_001161 [Ampulex compressa]